MQIRELQIGTSWRGTFEIIDRSLLSFVNLQILQSLRLFMRLVLLVVVTCVHRVGWLAIGQFKSSHFLVWWITNISVVAVWKKVVLLRLGKLRLSLSQIILLLMTGHITCDLITLLVSEAFLSSHSLLLAFFNLFLLCSYSFDALSAFHFFTFRFEVLARCLCKQSWRLPALLTSIFPQLHVLLQLSLLKALCP